MKLNGLKVILYGVLIFVWSLPCTLYSVQLTFINSSGKDVQVMLEGWKKGYVWQDVRTVKSGKSAYWKPYFNKNISQDILAYRYEKNKPYKRLRIPKFKGYTVPSGYKRSLELKEDGIFNDELRKGERSLSGIWRLGVELFEKSAEKALLAMYKILAPARKFIRNVRNPLNPIPYDIIHTNPYAQAEAKVRVGGTIAPKAEHECFRKRQAFVRPVQEQFLDNPFVAGEKSLVIACAGSGGGQRAALGSSGFAVGMKKIALLDAVTYFSALSGSTWMLAPWLMSGLDIETFRDNLVKDAERGLQLRDPVIDIKHATDIYNTKLAFGQPLNLMDIYGSLLSIKYLRGLGEFNNPQRCYLSSLASKIVDGARVIPIFDVVTAEIGMGHRWCWFTPWEFGGRWFGRFGAYIPIWSFGRMFKNGISVNRGTAKKPLYGPRPTLGFLMAAWGSAPAATGGQVYDNIIKDMKPGTIKTIFRFLLKKTDFKKIRALWVSIFNCLRGVIGSDFARFRILRLADAGVKMGCPIFSTYRRPADGKIKDGRAPDILFVFDSSAEVGASELCMQEAYAKKHNLPFPKIDYEGVGERAISIFTEKPEDSHFLEYEIPTVVYMPRIVDRVLLDEFKSDPRFKDAIAQLGDFDINTCLDGPCTTFNFKYPPQTAKKLSLNMELNVRMNEELIRKVLQDRRKVNQIRDGILQQGPGAMRSLG